MSKNSGKIVKVIALLFFFTTVVVCIRIIKSATEIWYLESPMFRMIVVLCGSWIVGSFVLNIVAYTIGETWEKVDDVQNTLKKMNDTLLYLKDNVPNNDNKQTDASNSKLDLSEVASNEKYSTKKTNYTEIDYSTPWTCKCGKRNKSDYRSCIKCGEPRNPES